MVFSFWTKTNRMFLEFTCELHGDWEQEGGNAMQRLTSCDESQSRKGISWNPLWSFALSCGVFERSRCNLHVLMRRPFKNRTQVSRDFINPPQISIPFRISWFVFVIKLWQRLTLVYMCTYGNSRLLPAKHHCTNWTTKRNQSLNQQHERCMKWQFVTIFFFYGWEKCFQKFLLGLPIPTTFGYY